MIQVVEKIIIKGNKYNISCKVYLPSKIENLKEIIIACHGFAGDKNSSAIEFLADEMIKSNIGVICFDFPGHGESEVSADQLTIQNCIDDINRVEEFVIEKYNNTEVSIFATSYGAYISLLNIARNKKNYKKIILRAPAIEMAQIFENALLKDKIEEYRNRGFTMLGFERELCIPYSFLEELRNNQIMDIYSNMSIPMINIIQGDQDDIAPIDDTKKFVKLDEKKVKLFLIPGADHRMKGPGELEKAIEYSKKIILEED